MFIQTLGSVVVVMAICLGLSFATKAVVLPVLAKVVKRN